jgi:hypothetical protein
VRRFRDTEDDTRTIVAALIQQLQLVQTELDAEGEASMRTAVDKLIAGK